jgi:hypothetical protein
LPSPCRRRILPRQASRVVKFTAFTPFHLRLGDIDRKTGRAIPSACPIEPRWAQIRYLESHLAGYDRWRGTGDHVMGGWKPILAGFGCFLLGMTVLTVRNTDIAFLKMLLEHGRNWIAVLLFIAGAFSAAWGWFGDEDSRVSVILGAVAVAMLNVFGLITTLPKFAPASLSMVGL